MIKSSRAVIAVLLCFVAIPLFPQNTVIKAGHLFDARSGKMISDQVIIVSNGVIKKVGKNLQYSSSDTVIDLSDSWVLPGLMDCHVHLGLNFKYRNVSYEQTYTTESSSLRALRAAFVAEQFLTSGFTTVNEIGNDANYATADVIKAIKYGWFNGPNIFYSGKIIGPYGGQTSESSIENEHLWDFEYLDADNPDEIRKAIRKNIYYGANVIKLVADQHSYYYDEADIRAAVEEAKKAGLKVRVHATGGAPARNVIMGGAAAIEHGFGLDDELLRLMKDKGTFLVGTDVPADVYYDWGMDSATSKYREGVAVDRLKRAYRIGVKMAYGTDVVIDEPGLNRIQTTMKVLKTWKAANIPPSYILQTMTIYAAELLGIEKSRGLLEPSYIADIVALKINPMDDIDSIKSIHFVMKEGKIVRR